jgi:AcrR family transcriptional regulator
MASPRDSAPPGTRRRRADAERSVARILDAGLDALTSDPDASMAEIAHSAGVVRATIYVHFPDRESLVAAVTDRAIAEVVEVIEEAGLERDAPAEALGGVVETTWRALGRFHALVAINTRLPPAELHRRHAPVIELLQPLIERGQREGAFRTDVSAEWHLSMVLALVHAASAELRAGRGSEDEIEAAVVATVLGAVGS